LADGKFQSFEIEIEVEHSWWIAIRILPSDYTNPIFVHVAGAVIRWNRKRAQWCTDSVAACWRSKKNQIHESEREAASAAYQAAAEIYEQVLAESK